MRRKNLKLISAMSILSMMIGGCGAMEVAKGPIKIEQNKTVEKNEDTRSITLLASQNWIKDVDHVLFKKFEEETGVEVKVMVTTDNGYEALLGTAMAGGSSSIDIFLYQAGQPMIFAGIPKVTVELTDEPWVPRLNEWAYKANCYEDVLYGFSTWSMDYEGVLYNKSYFKEHGLEVPTTWEELIVLCEQIINLGEIPFYEPINVTWHTQSFLGAMTPVLKTENPRFIEDLNNDRETKFADSVQLKVGLTQIQQLLATTTNGKPRYFTTNGQAEDWFGSYESLKNRETVMMFTYSAYATELREQGSTDEWGMFPLPICDNQTIVSNGGGISKFINKNSENIAICKMLFEFLAREENLAYYYASRTDLAEGSFKEVGVATLNPMLQEVINVSKDEVENILIKEVIYWDPGIYKYFQQLSIGQLDVDGFIEAMDSYRMTMLDITTSNKGE